MLPKMTTSWAAALAVPTVAAALIGSTCLGQGVGTRAGQAVDNAGRTIRNGIQNAFAKTRASVHEQEILARVYSRVHWDKMLVGSTIEIDATEAGMITLRGAVPTEAAKKRAEILARDTVDVTSVVDDLTVVPPVTTRTTTTTTETTTTTPPVIKP